MRLNGCIDKIIFRNGENGYTVASVRSGSDTFTCVGNLPFCSEGEDVELEGEFKNTKYGEQFVVSKISVKPPTGKAAIKRYLTSGLIKGIGEVTATALVDKFGEDVLDVIENSPEKVASIRGISLKKAQAFKDNIRSLRDMQNAVMFLQTYGVTTNMALKIFRVYGADTENVVKGNPYKLVEDIEGIGFLTGDKLAQKMGISRDSNFRIRAGVIFVLCEHTLGTGSTYCKKEEIVVHTLQTLELDDVCRERVNIVVKALDVEGQVIEFFDENDEVCVALRNYYLIEKSLAVKLIRLKTSYKTPELNDYASEIAEFERMNGISLHENQKQAIINSINSGVSVITGGPGTGKTTIIKCLMFLLRKRGISPMLTAPTGRAAKRLSEASGAEAKTIHRLLDIDYKNGEGVFTYNDNTRLDTKCVIVDEVSMVDCRLMKNLASAINLGAQLIVVGDKDQLPSVSCGNVLSDLITSGVINVTQLTQIYRQKENSHIITNAHRINNGQMPIFAGKDSDFLHCQRETPDEILSELISIWYRRIPKYLGVTPQDIQILAPMKKGVCGVDNLNRELQTLVNPKQKGKAEILLDNNVVFRQNDKVMQTVNNYNLEWKRFFPDGVESGKGVFNGDIGRIISVNQSTTEIEVEFEDGRVSVYGFGDISDLTLSYAISVHKSQGCEFDTVIMPVTGGMPMLFNKNLLYTAVTRAKKLVVLIGRKSNVAYMVHNDYVEKRWTMLSRFLTELDGRLDAVNGEYVNMEV